MRMTQPCSSKSGQGVKVFVNKAELAVSSVIEWFAANRLQINVRKTRIMVFGRNSQVVKGLKVVW